MKNKVTYFVILAAFAILSLTSVATAQQSILEIGGGQARGLGPKAAMVDFAVCIRDGNCGAEHIFVLANNIIKYLAGISGALALLMYVIGGVWMIFSAGNSSRVERGKDIIIGTSMALVSILGSWVIINFVLTGLGTKPEIGIQVLSCGPSGDCPPGQVCLNGTSCVDRCKMIDDADVPNTWVCQDPKTCDTTYDACKAGQADNCVVNQCGKESDTRVCCYDETP
jgi:hypothetical protein